MGSMVDEFKRLRGSVNDLVCARALWENWSRGETGRRVDLLLQTLMEMLDDLERLALTVADASRPAHDRLILDDISACIVERHGDQLRARANAPPRIG